MLKKFRDWMNLDSGYEVPTFETVTITTQEHISINENITSYEIDGPGVKISNREDKKLTTALYLPGGFVVDIKEQEDYIQPEDQGENKE